jgi:hypothetical protein
VAGWRGILERAIGHLALQNGRPRSKLIWLEIAD